MSSPEALDIAPQTDDVTAAATSSAASTRIQLWDLPLRIFHWSLVTAVSTAIITGKAGGSWMAIHSYAGQTIVGLLVFRIVWGLIGSDTARFAHFVPSPARIVAYLQGQWQGLGHNPLGALSVIALLGVLLTQAVTGLFGNDDIAFTGPLVSLVADELSLKLTGIHRQLINVVYLLLALHITAIVFYARVKRDKLVKPMVTGWKDVPADTPAPRTAGPLALVVAIAMAAAAAYGASGLWIKHAPAPTPAATTPAGGSGQTTTSNAPAW
jgi:cytochrome b